MSLLKMKDVLSETGLTDRAVRIYISKGLLFPSINEKYNGRREIDFSEEDIQRLKQIAILRKAGFPIVEIENLFSEDIDNRIVIKRIINTKAEQIENDSRIVDILKSSMETGALAVNDICNALTQQTGTKSLPPEDTAPEKAERIARIAIPVYFILNLVLNSAYPILYFMFRKEFRYILPDGYIVYLQTIFLPWILQACLCIGIVIATFRKKIKNTGFYLFCIAAAVASVVILMFSWLFGCMSLTAQVSQTDNPKYYMLTDNYVRERAEYDTICSVFPEQIPETAKTAQTTSGKNGYPETTKYYYRYAEFLEDPTIDIIAEWQLPEKEYNEAKERGSIERATVVQIGNWTVFFHSESDVCAFELPAENKKDFCFYLLFACNDQTHTVRYITSIKDYAVGIPQFLTIDW